MTKHLRLIMLSLLAMICMGGYAQSDELHKTLSFPDENQDVSGVSSYEKDWTATIGTDTWTISNFNNNNWKNGWESIKCGRRNYASEASIATDTDLGAAITRVVVNYGTVKNVTDITYCRLTVASDAKFQNIIERKKTTPLTPTTKKTEFVVTNPKEGLYYKIEYKLAESSANGFVEISNVEYYKKSDKADSEIKFKEAAKEVELNTKTMRLSDMISNPHNLPLTYSTSDKETAAELGGTLHLYKTGKVKVTASFAGDATYAATKTSMELTIVDNRQDAGIHFAKDSYTADFANSTFNGAELVIPKDLEVAYEITPEREGVSIAEDGTVTYPAVEAIYTVTAKFAGNDTYKPATATYTLNVVDPNFEIQTIEFVAGVDKGTGASTGNIKDDMISKGIVTVSSTRACLGFSDKDYYAFYKPASANKGIHTISTRMGTITKIAFEAGNGKEPSKAKFEKGTYTKDTDGTKNYTWTGSEKNINFTVTGTTFYSKITVTVKVPVAKDYTLDENSVNTIEAYENANVTLKRTFYKDGGWNTLCLPFAVNATDFEGAEVREVDVTQSSENTLVFKEATTIKAGKPYLIKWAKTPNEVCDFVNTFEGVTLVATATPVKVNDAITFTGFYNKATADKLGASVAAIGAGNKLFKVTSGEMKGFRAAFVLNPASPAAGIKVVIDGTTTGIEDLVVDGVKANGRVYNLNGQYVGNSLNGLLPGIYIQNGKKVVVK